jgi:hypothetical protein
MVTTMLRVTSARAAHAHREDTEARVQTVMDDSVQQWLALVRDATLRAVRDAPRTGVLALSASAVPDEPPTLGQMATWWAATVDANVTQTIESMWHEAYRTQQDATVRGSSVEFAKTFAAQVKQRIKTGTYNGVTAYDDAMDRIRASLASSVALGWSRQTLAERISVDLGWAKDDDYWRGQKSGAVAKMAEILDRYGKPGDAAREHAKTSDPVYNAWRAQANDATARLDATRNVWQNRSVTIARTEGTATWNSAALMAVNDEGHATKQWLATVDDRTRDSHLDADGQEVPTPQPFNVGGEMLMMPGDPNGSAAEVVNCRCTLIGGGL